MTAAPPPLTQAQQEADLRLSRLIVGGTVEKQIDLCIEILVKPPAQDPDLRDAAVRRIDVTDARKVLERVGPHLRTASSSAERVELVRLLGNLFHRLGGIDPSANTMIVDQIRSNDLVVAREAIEVASELQLRDAYLPLREIATNAGSPLRPQALDGLVRLGDPRALTFFTKLLETDAAPRDQIYKGMSAIGRPASIFLKGKLLDPDPAERARALDALLPMVTVEDLSTLYLLIERFPPEGELKTRLYATIARLEAVMAAHQPKAG